MNKRMIAALLAAGIEGAARLPGRAFYRFFLDHVNRRYLDDNLVVSVPAGEVMMRLACPNRLTRWRAETLRTKEPATIAWIDGFAPNDVFWDVGANIGLYGLYAAVTRGCRVLAFEPAPANYAILARNVELNDVAARMAAFPLALGDSRKIGRLSMRSTDAGSAFSSFGRADGNAAVVLDCLGYSADGFFADFSPPPPNHMKIDVDGTEEDILAGAARLLAMPQLRSVQIELDQRAPDQMARIGAIMESRGFRAMEPKKSPLFPDSPAVNYLYRRNP